MPYSAEVSGELVKRSGTLTERPKLRVGKGKQSRALLLQQRLKVLGMRQ